MDKNSIPKKQYLIDSAIADIAINDLGLTLDEPEFAGSLCPWAKYDEKEYGNDSKSINLKRYDTLTYMTYYLCLLQGGTDLAIQLAEKSGLLNCKISDTKIVTADYIIDYMYELHDEFMLLKHIDAECELATHYQQLFKEYCLKHMNEWRLNHQISFKIEEYIK